MKGRAGSIVDNRIVTFPRRAPLYATFHQLRVIASARGERAANQSGARCRARVQCAIDQNTRPQRALGEDDVLVCLRIHRLLLDAHFGNG